MIEGNFYIKIPTIRHLLYSEQYYNRKLKVLFEAAGLDRIIVKYDKVRKTDVQKPLYSLATSHTARKTAISRLYNAGCPLDMINDICGHVGDDIKSRHAEFDLSSKLEYMNQICPWYIIEQPLIDVKMLLLSKTNNRQQEIYTIYYK